MKRRLVALLCCFATAAGAQTSPGFVTGQTLPAAQLNAAFSNKADYPGLNITALTGDCNAGGPGTATTICLKTNGVAFGALATLTPGAGVATALGLAASGSGSICLTTSCVMVGPNLGTPSALILTNATGLPVGGLTGLGTGVATALGLAVSGSGSFCLTTACALSLTNATGLPLTTGVTGVLPAANIAASVRVRAFGTAFGSTQGSALTSGGTSYLTIPYACTISAWNMTLDAGTATIDVWKIATGTAIPTVANTITASALPAISSGTALHSTTLTGWTTAVAANDIVGINLQAVATAKYVSIVLECDQ